MLAMNRHSKVLLAASLLCCTLSPIPAHGAEVPQTHTSDAAGIRQEQNPEGYAALQRFTTAHRQLHGDEPAYRIRPNDYSVACGSSISPACLDYLLSDAASSTSPVSKLPELTGTRDYWNSYRRYFKTSPIGEPISRDGQFYGDASAERGYLIEAAIAWPKAQIASSKRINVPEAATDFLHIRDLARRSSTLMDRMTFVALMGIQMRTINLAAAQAANENDQVAIQAVKLAIKPLSALELSMRNSLSGEGNYSGLLTNTMGLNAADPLELFQFQLDHNRKLFEEHGIEMKEPQLLSQPEFDERRSRFRGARQAFRNTNVIAIQLSEETSATFWGESPHWLDLRGVESEHSWALPMYVDYLYSNRTLEIQLAVIRALADHYFSNVPLRVPDDPPPPHFDWAWREDTRELCLIPVSVNSVIAANVAPACQPAWALATNSLNESTQ